ncbi:hypothetical protein GE21DRAFT_8219 [Neurospora crassa]|uniref:Uncharacterized protein n=2 Tax=Neurospora crassa TaxID=5141 RepID=Q1K6U6_NEUCR|nr:hypothetical protein NCU04227 [Neurospora crassa OR74A]EAA31615.1 hypothetical protein NCU04227 [Neurospora crassa OR74A]KHE86076.1 hypothetical protein GE21DRAFT_8219 [Neurospora crassa]CAD36999.1 putative protein [Neurospora crassa]|eukprot:XP_960851.1 hypothetical protein NCU04227 [Neurospora crassa OR74A]
MSLASTSLPQGGQSIPRLAGPFESDSGSGNATPRAVAGDEGGASEEKKAKKRSLFGFGKKKEDASSASKSPEPSTTSQEKATSWVKRSTGASPVQSDVYITPQSPGRGFTSSPRLSSPAGSQIFERDVQESTSMVPNSPAIPSHIQTENYIPPVLDASSQAITDKRLDPDTVEIITHTSHQPAAVTVTGAAPTAVPLSLESSWVDELAAFAAARGAITGNETASNYGSFDNTDVRRLSFISFADVVQAEQLQVAGSRDSMHFAGLTSLTPTGVNRSPSPVRSPVSSSGGHNTSPPTSKSGSVKGLDFGTIPGSPGRKPLGSPTSLLHPSPVVNGEIAIETMSQALRRTGSGDLSGGVRSFPVSPV